MKNFRGEIYSNIGNGHTINILIFKLDIDTILINRNLIGIYEKTFLKEDS